MTERGRRSPRDKCKEIDAKIARYRQISADAKDNTVTTLLNTFIADLESERISLSQQADE